MNNIFDLLKKTFEGAGLSEDQEKQFNSLYLVAFYKSLLEVMLSLKTTDRNFVMGVQDFFNSALSGLNNEEKVALERVMEKEKARILSQMISIFQEKLPAEVSGKISSNLDNLLNTPT